MLQSSPFTEASLGVKYDKGKKRTSRSWLSYARGIHARFLPGLRHAQVDIAAGTHAASIKSVERKDVTWAITEVIFETLREDTRKGFEIPADDLNTGFSFEDGIRYNINQALSFIYRLADALSTGKTELVYGEVIPQQPKTLTVNGSVIMKRYPGRTCLDVATLLWRDFRNAQQNARAPFNSKLRSPQQIIDSEFRNQIKWQYKPLEGFDFAYYDTPYAGAILLISLNYFAGHFISNHSYDLNLKLTNQSTAFRYDRFDLEAAKLISRVKDALLHEKLERDKGSDVKRYSIWIGIYLPSDERNWEDAFYPVKIFDLIKNPIRVCLAPWRNINRTENTDIGINLIYKDNSATTLRNAELQSTDEIQPNLKHPDSPVSRLTSHLNAPLLVDEITKPEDATTWGIRLDAKKGLQIPPSNHSE